MSQSTEPSTIWLTQDAHDKLHAELENLKGPVRQEIVARNSYRVIDRDTVLPAAFREEGDLIVVDAVVRLEGSVNGSIGVVGGSFFLRPGARIGGVVVAVAGTIGMSSLATLGDALLHALRRAHGDGHLLLGGLRVGVLTRGEEEGGRQKDEDAAEDSAYLVHVSPL